MDEITKKTVTIINKLPKYHNVQADLRAVEKTVTNIINSPKGKMTFDRFGTTMPGIDGEESFVMSLRKGFIRYIKEGTPIAELSPTEIPSPRENVEPENDNKPLYNEDDSEDSKNPNKGLIKRYLKSHSQADLTCKLE